jgi:PAS domain S-box-containing protein
MVCKDPLAEGVAVTLEDCSAPEGDRLLATGGSGVAEELFGLATNAAWSELPLQFAGRKWRLRVAPTQAFAAANRNLQSWAILAGGLCFCSLLGAVLLVITGQKAAVESLVLARTGQLSAANENLVEQIRERQRIEVTLVEEEGRLRALMDGVVDGIATCAADGTIDAFNGAFAELFGCSPATLAGRPLSALLPRWGGAGQVEGEVARPAGPPERLETTGLRPDGTEFPVEVGARAFVAQGRRQTAIIVRDISERHEIDRMKNEFISTVSHELRTPLTAIRGSLGLLDGGVAGKLSPAAAPLLTMSMRNVDRLLLLINDLLDADRIVSGRMTYNLRPVPVGELLRQSQAANAAYAAQYEVTLQVDDRADGASVVADSDRLLQVLANLLSNAAKFSPRGGSVTLGARWEPPVVKLWVSDRGPGIPEEFRARIFSRFCQADASDTRQKGGTGLGLNISRGLVEQMGGRLDFESRPGEGTTFTCELPGQPPAARV